MKHWVDLLWFAATLTALLIGYRVGEVRTRQTMQEVACKPVVRGLRKNGKEIPLTSAQRDSLSGVR